MKSAKLGRGRSARGSSIPDGERENARNNEEDVETHRRKGGRHNPLVRLAERRGDARQLESKFAVHALDGQGCARHD